ncbi:MAG: EAL domain-containing response regulator [Pseudolabrys sp.]|nr:EAL domain-containing response regulator [Pseudolabrys sp.]
MSTAPDSPTAAKTGAPVCWVVDEDSSLRHFLSLLLHGVGVDAVEYSDGAAMRADIGKPPPDLVFHNISLESADAIESVVALGKSGFRGAVQLMSNRGSAVLDHVKTIGLQHKLNMLAALKKPFDTAAVLKMITDLKIGIGAPAAARISLDEALAGTMVEFWYQPKIDMRRKQLAGAEAFARVQHPQHGLIMPGAFMPGASEADIVKLAELSVVSALKAQAAFSKIGIHLRMSVNVPWATLLKMDIPALVATQRKAGEKWPGLLIDVTEQQVIDELPAVTELTKKIESSNVRLAIDDFGRACSTMAKVKELPFAELKLDREFVTDCGTDKMKAPLCKAAIDLAHNFGSAVVAVGIEKAADAVALVSMGCDFGQGFLFGQPMPEDRLVSLLRQRSGGNAAKPAA